MPDSVAVIQVVSTVMPSYSQIITVTNGWV